MQCLQSAGINCLGNAPGYEDPRTVEEGIMPTDLMLDAQGGAIKLLEPHCRFLPKGFEYLVIATDRDKLQQAKSYYKFLNKLGASTKMSEKKAVRKLKSMLVSHQKQADSVLKLLDCPFYRVSFEDLMNNPKEALKELSEDLGLDMDKLVRPILPRSSKCAKVMIELGLIKDFKPAPVGAN